MALSLQPVLLLYTRSVMHAAAAQTARAAATARSGADAGEYEAFALRRLAAVPALDVFHVGGEEGWEVSVEGMGEGSRRVTVRIVGRTRTLPLLGVEASAFGQVEGSVVTLEAEVSERVRADWIGGGYASWVSVWD